MSTETTFEHEHDDDDHEEGALVGPGSRHLREAQVELALAAVDEYRQERIEAMDNLLARVAKAREGTRPDSFLKGDYDRLIDKGLETRKRYGAPLPRPGDTIHDV